MEKLGEDFYQALSECELDSSKILGRFNFNFLMDLLEEQCEDSYLQALANKISKKLWEILEIQEQYEDFENFDGCFNMDLVGYGEECELEEEYEYITEK